MIRTESEKKIELKKKDVKKTRKKLNTLIKDSPVFGTSLCILERFVFIVCWYLYIFAHKQYKYWDFMFWVACSGETKLRFLYLCRAVLRRSPTGKEHRFLQ